MEKWYPFLSWDTLIFPALERYSAVSSLLGIDTIVSWSYMLLSYQSKLLKWGSHCMKNPFLLKSDTFTSAPAGSSPASSSMAAAIRCLT